MNAPGTSHQKPLTISAAAQLMQQFAGSGVEWWMAPVTDLDANSNEPRQPVDLVVWGQGQQLGRWRLHSAAYGGLVTRLSRQPQGPFVVPHPVDYRYEDYDEIPGRLAEASEVVALALPVMATLWERMTALDATAGVELAEAELWWLQAETVLDALRWRTFRHTEMFVGPPNYYRHSSYLAEMTIWVRHMLAELESFINHVPPPGLAKPGLKARQLTTGDNSRFKKQQYF